MSGHTKPAILGITESKLKELWFAPLLSIK